MKKCFNFKFLILIIIPIVVGLVIAVSIMLEIPIVDLHPATYDFQAGSKWYASENDINVEAVYEEKYDNVFLYGTILSDEDLVNVKLNEKAGTFYFSSEDFGIIIADYKVKNNGDIVLKNIKYDEEIEWDSTPKKIVLEKIE